MKIFKEKRLVLSVIWLCLAGYLIIPVPLASGKQNFYFYPTCGSHLKPKDNGKGPGSPNSRHQKMFQGTGFSRDGIPTFLAENSPKSHENADSAIKITGIRFKILYSGEEKVIILGRGITPPLIFALEGKNPRVVCDFKGTDLGSGIASEIKTGGKFIKMIRTGLHKGGGGKVRVVLDLSPEESYEVEQTFYKNQHTYELIIKPEKSISQ